MEKIVKWIRRWSFLAVLLVTGIIYLTCTDNWQVYFKDTRENVESETPPEPEAVERVVHNPPLRDIGKKKPGMLPAEALANGWISLVPMDVSANETGAVSGGDAASDEASNGAVADGESSNGEAPSGEGTDAESGDDTWAEAGSTEPEEIPWYELTYRDPADIVYTSVEDSYFADAVFLGDSRTVGMYEYGGLKDISTFYASTGLNIYKLMEAKIVEVSYQKEKISVEQALQENRFEKIYLMIGINEMGIGTVDSFMEKYREVVARIRELQPEAIIYLQGIMKVTTERSAKGDYIHNEGIEARNAEIAKLADNIWIYYLDVNSCICDESGGMESSYTYDGVHLKAQYVTIWKDYLKTHAVEKLLLD